MNDIHTPMVIQKWHLIKMILTLNALILYFLETVGKPDKLTWHPQYVCHPIHWSTSSRTPLVRSCKTTIRSTPHQVSQPHHQGELALQQDVGRRTQYIQLHKIDAFEKETTN